jgi:hypothetical protein
VTATALVLFVSVAAPPEAPSVVKAEPDAALSARFRSKDGWVGGDGAYSVALSETRALWLFSDTWVGAVRDGKRKGVALVNNTVGVQDGKGADAKLAFFVHRNADGKPTALFAPPDGKGWFWQYAGHYADGTLHVFLPRFEKASGSAAFGFKGSDLWLGSVSNPDAEPTKWKTTYAKVPFAELSGERKRSFGSAVLTVGEHVYVYGYAESPGQPFPARQLLVARAPKARLADFDGWRFLTAGEWKSDAKAATGSAHDLATEFSVSYLPGLKRYALAYTESGLSDRIVGRFAPAPEGPWSEAVPLYRCPEMKADEKVFSYAAKAHPHLAGEDELVISYVVNAFELGPVMENADLYWPTFVRVRLK